MGVFCLPSPIWGIFRVREKPGCPFQARLFALVAARLAKRPPSRPPLPRSWGMLGSTHRRYATPKTGPACARPSDTPIPPPLPAGKGNESPSVGRGAGRAALRLLLLPPAGERGVVPRASRVRFASILTRSVLGLRPALRMRLPVEPLTPFPLQQPPDQMRATGRDAIFWASVRAGVSGRDLWPWR